MAGDGGDTGGGFDSSSSSSTGSGDSGGAGKGGMGQGETGAAGKGAGGGATFDPGGNTADYSGGGGYGDPTSGYAPSDSGVGGGLPSEITTGASDTTGGSQWGAPSINDFIAPGTDGGFNLGGSGPVGGDSGLPGAGGGTNTPMAFDTYSTSGGTVPAAADNAVAAAPAANNATAFAAPEGVSGTPQLDSLVAAPDSSNSVTGLSPSDQSVFDSLNGAQAATVDQQANNYTPTSSPVGGGSTTLPAVSAPGGSSGGGGNSQTTGILPGISNNTLGIGAAGVGLLNNLVNGNRPLANATNLTGNATSANTVATQQNEAGVALQQYVATGQLPAGYEDQVQQAAQSAKQTIISNYANRGLPTDPTRNSTLAQELAQVDARLPAMREQIAADLAKTGSGMVSAGLTASGISSGIYQTLANLENSQNNQRGAAIANFAAALNGGTRPKAA